MAENREAWLVAGSSFLATVIALGAVLVFGGNDSAPVSKARAVVQPATPMPTKAPPKTPKAQSRPPDSPSSSPAQAVDRLLEPWVADDRVAARRVATQAAVEQFFEEPLQYRSDFYLSGCDKYRGDWTCSLGYGLDDTVGYSLGIERSDASFWVGFVHLIVL